MTTKILIRGILYVLTLSVQHLTLQDPTAKLAVKIVFLGNKLLEIVKNQWRRKILKLNLTISTGAKIKIVRIIRMATKVINQVSLVCTTIPNIISKINMIIIRHRWLGNSITRIINNTSCTNITNSWNINIKAIKIIWCKSERVLFMEKVHNIKILFKWCKLRPMRMLLVVSYIFSRWQKFNKTLTIEHITCSNKLLLGAWYMVLMECHLCLFSTLLWMAPHLLIMGFPAKKCHIMCLYLR
jgi:hypothetical protein